MAPLNVCVFCGSSPGINPRYVEAAEELGAELVKQGLGLVYGGGNAGLMGTVAKVVHDQGGKVLGVLPNAMMSIEGLGLLGETILVPDMHTRKATMNARSDGFIALPGGFGTFEELLEVTTWVQLSIIDKPVVVYNVNGYFDALKALFNKGVEEGFIRAKNKQIVVFADTAEEVVKAIVGYQTPEGRFDIKWENKQLPI